MNCIKHVYGAPTHFLPPLATHGLPPLVMVSRRRLRRRAEPASRVAAAPGLLQPLRGSPPTALPVARRDRHGVFAFVSQG